MNVKAYKEFVSKHGFNTRTELINYLKNGGVISNDSGDEYW